MTTIDIFRYASDGESFTAGQVIVAAGQPGDTMYIVQEGQVDITTGGEIVATLGPGEPVGEMALIDGGPRSATVIAKTDCRLVPIDEQRFLFLTQQTPFFALQVMRVIVARLRGQMGAPA